MQMRSLRDTRQPEVDSFKLATIGADNSAMDYNDPVKAGAGRGGWGVGRAVVLSSTWSSFGHASFIRNSHQSRACTVLSPREIEIENKLMQSLGANEFVMEQCVSCEWTHGFLRLRFRIIYRILVKKIRFRIQESREVFFRWKAA